MDVLAPKNENFRACGLRRVFHVKVCSEIIESTNNIMSNHIRWCVKIVNKVDNNYVIVCRRRRRENFGTVPPKHDFPMQKQCFGSVSEAFSTAKPLKNSQFF